jgi:hypothetical protein
MFVIFPDIYFTVKSIILIQTELSDIYLQHIRFGVSKGKTCIILDNLLPRLIITYNDILKDKKVLNSILNLGQI